MECYSFWGNRREMLSEREGFVKEIQKGMLLSFTDLIEKRDAATGRHVKRTGIYVRILANALKEHPLVGIEMLETIIYGVGENEYLQFTYDMILSHHEKWDGSGYPRGIAGESIPLSARIMAVADVFEALVSKRCYKEACSYEQAFEIIKNSAGTHFDPVLVEVFLNKKEEIKCAG